MIEIPADPYPAPPDAMAFDPEAVIDAMAPLLGLDIKPESRDGVAANLRIVAAMAALVMDAPQDDGAEPAPVFRPLERVTPGAGTALGAGMAQGLGRTP